MRGGSEREREEEGRLQEGDNLLREAVGGRRP